MERKFCLRNLSLFFGLSAFALSLTSCDNNSSTTTTTTKTDSTKTVVSAETKAANMKHYQSHLLNQQRYKDRMAARKKTAPPKTGNKMAVPKNAPSAPPKTSMAMSQGNTFDAANNNNIGSQLCTGYLITYGQLQVLPAFIDFGSPKQKTNVKRIGINIYDAIMNNPTTGAMDTMFIFAPADSSTHLPDTISSDMNSFYFTSNGLCPTDCDLSASIPTATVVPYLNAMPGVKSSFGAEPANTNMLALNMTIMYKIFTIPNLSGVQITFGCLEDGSVVIDYVPLISNGEFDGSADIITDNAPVASLMMLPIPGK